MIARLSRLVAVSALCLAWVPAPGDPLAQDPDAEAVLQEIGGRKADGSFVSTYEELEEDGSTACGSWIHAGIYKDGVNQTARRKPHTEQNWISPEWGWSWPLNTRILYNRASADPEGNPWSERKRYAWWDAEQGKWDSLGDHVGRLPGPVPPSASQGPFLRPPGHAAPPPPAQRVMARLPHHGGGKRPIPGAARPRLPPGEGHEASADQRRRRRPERIGRQGLLGPLA